MGDTTTRPHFHTGIDHILLTGITAIVVIDVLGLAAAQLAQRSGMVGSFGRALGAVVPFKG